MKYYLTFNYGERKSSLLTLLVISFIMVFDSIVVTIIYNTREPPNNVSLIIYGILATSFVFTNYLLLGYSTKYLQSGKRLKQRLYTSIIVAIQIALCTLVFVPVVQLFFFKEYTISGLEMTTYISLVSGLMSLSILTYQFFKWIRSNRKLIIIMYAFSFIFFILILVTSILFFNAKFSSYLPEISMRSIIPAILDTPSLDPASNNITLVYDYLSVISFIFAWIPAMMLLRTHSTTSGSLKFAILIALPLIYYLIPFTTTQLGIFDTLRVEHGRQFNLIYSMLFAPYKQIGGILFGLVFLLAAGKTNKKSLQLLITLSGIGMTIVFASTVTHGLRYIVSPPFGIITVAYTGLGSYILFIGLYYSTKVLATDSTIRSEIQRSVSQQFSILRTLSATEREITIQNTVKRIIKKNFDSIESENENSVTVEDYRETVKEVLHELNSRREKTADNE